MPNFQNNFATNLTSNTTAGATTSPINSIPTVDAPYYLAFDATNVNGHYEVKLVTSDTATNVNHTATAYDHSTDEEVRLVDPAGHKNTMQNTPQGFLLNGKIVPSVGSNNLTVAIKTLAGATPSESDPVYCRIGDTIRSVTSALSVTKNAGTNWCNAGSSELATKEIDYFVYLGYNATDGVVIGFSRYPGANSYDDFSATTTNEKYCGISTITNASATDYYEVVGRFAATLSAGAGYTWSVPTYTAKNLIQRPIFETRWLTWQPVFSGNGSMTWTSVSTVLARYRLSGNICSIAFDFTGTAGGTASFALQFTAPIYAYNLGSGVPTVGMLVQDAGQAIGQVRWNSTLFQALKADGSNFGLGANRITRGTYHYEI